MPSRVLVVEDEPDIRELVIHHLKREGYQVSAAASGEEALRQVLSALLARVRAVLRRSRNATGPASTTVGALTIDRGEHTVSVGGLAVTLTPKEFDLLRALVEARGRVLSRDFLLDRVWGYASSGEIESRTVDVHVRRLRVKLGSEGRRVLTVKSVGYRLDTGA